MPITFHGSLATGTEKKSGGITFAGSLASQKINKKLTASEVARAIKTTESGGNYKAKGGSGEFGAYQFMPGSWADWATEYSRAKKLKYDLAPTPENQDKVAQFKIQQRIDKGEGLEQIAAWWNSGSSQNWQSKVGVNKFGVKYDVPGYVNKVVGNYPGPKQFEQMLQNQPTLSQATGEELQADIFGNPIKPKTGNMLTSLVKDIAGGASDVAKFFGQGTARFAASSTLQPDEKFTPDNSKTLLGKANQFVFGEEPINSLTKNLAEETLRGEEYYGKASMPIAFAGILGAELANLFGAGGSKKAITEIVNIKTIEKAIPWLNKLGIFGDDAIKLAPKIVGANAPKEAKIVLDELGKVSKLAPQAQKAASVASKVDDAINPLAQEARKYKSAEEFVKKAEIEVPIKDILPTEGHTPEVMKGKLPAKGYENQPIRVEINKDGKLQIQDGNRRYYTALERGDKKVKVIFNDQAPMLNFEGEFDRIKNFYNQATKKPTIGKFDTIESVTKELDKQVEKYRKEAGLMASNEGAGVRMYENKNIQVDTGDKTPSTYFKLQRAKNDMYKRARDAKAEAHRNLYDNDENYRKLYDKKVDMLEIEVNKPVNEIDVNSLFSDVNKEIQLNENINEATSKSISETQGIKSKALSQNEKVTGVRSISAVERGFISSVKEALPEAKKVAGQYIPRSTDDLAIKAKNFIRDDIVGAERLAMTGADDSAVAVASELIKKYGDDAAKATDEVQAGILYDKAAEIANTIAPKLTEAGRTVQAASILGRLTPEGQIRFAAKHIQKYNETAVRKIPELTGQQAKFISEEMKTIQGMKNGIERAEKFQKLQDYIKDLVPTPLIKKIIAVWKAGLLTGVKTSGLNLFSNLSHSITETAKDIPATVVDSVASLFTGQRTKTFKGVSGKGLKEGFDKGLRYFKTGFDERNIAQKLDYTKVNFGKGKIAKVFQTYTDTVFRALGTADQPFYYGALARSLGDQATAQGLNKGLKGKALKEFSEKLVQNPTEEMLRYGIADASTAVFQNETYLGKAAKALQNIPIVGEIVVPFGRTPSAVATQIVNYTPIGTVAEIAKQVAKGKFDQRLFSEAVGRGMVGTAVLYLGWEMGKKSMIALDRPTGEREQKLWELEGRKPNSIKIGGKWRSPMVLGPAGNLLLIGGHFNKAFSESGSPTEALSEAAFGSAKSFTEQTFLTGLNQSNKALNDPKTYASSYLGNMVGSLVPTIVSDVSRATDPLERRKENISENVLARIPGARQSLEPQVDVLGKEVERIGNPLEVLIDPTRPYPIKDSPVINELRRLTDAGFEVSPTLLGDKKGYESLSQKENTQLWKRAGEIIDGKLGNLFNSEQYKKLKEDEKGKKVESFVDKSKLVARAEMVMILTEGLSGEALKQKLSELKAGGLMTREVYNKYIELR